MGSKAKITQIKKREDGYAIKSANILKRQATNHIKSVFRAALDMIELKFGKDFDGYKDIRAKILRAGNDAIRDFEDLVDHRFNVELVPDVVFYEKVEAKEKEVEERTGE